MLFDAQKCLWNIVSRRHMRDKSRQRKNSKLDPNTNKILWIRPISFITKCANPICKSRKEIETVTQKLFRTQSNEN